MVITSHRGLGFTAGALSSHRVKSSLGLPRWLRGKETTCNAGDAGGAGLIPGSGRSSGEENGKLLQYSCPENTGKKRLRRRLAGYSSWDCKESDATEHAHIQVQSSLEWLR